MLKLCSENMCLNSVALAWHDISTLIGSIASLCKLTYSRTQSYRTSTCVSSLHLHLFHAVGYSRLHPKRATVNNNDVHPFSHLDGYQFSSLHLLSDFLIQCTVPGINYVYCNVSV